MLALVPALWYPRSCLLQVCHPLLCGGVGGASRSTAAAQGGDGERGDWMASGLEKLAASDEAAAGGAGSAAGTSFPGDDKPRWLPPGLELSTSHLRRAWLSWRWGAPEVEMSPSLPY